MQIQKSIILQLFIILLSISAVKSQKNYLVSYLDLQMDFIKDSLVNELKQVDEFLVNFNASKTKITVTENARIAKWEEGESITAEEELLKKMVALVEHDIFRFPFTFSIAQLYKGNTQLLNLGDYQDSIEFAAARTVSLFAPHLEMDNKMQKQVTKQLVEYFEHKEQKIIDKFANAALQLLYPTVYLEKIAAKQNEEKAEKEEGDLNEEENELKETKKQAKELAQWTMDTTTVFLPVFNETLFHPIPVQLNAIQQIKENKTVWTITKTYEIEELLKQAKLVQPLFQNLSKDELVLLEKLEITLSDSFLYEKYAHEQFFNIPGMKIIQVKTIYVQEIDSLEGKND
ncbi:MAG: hypothetical protein JJT77_09660 [Crocinitomicaceae bacterium]|nr:hypothetical protein [Crocinitomicaceae bacterium]